MKNIKTNKNTVSFYNELHSQLETHRQSMVDTKASEIRNEVKDYIKIVAKNGNRERDFQDVFQSDPNVRYSFRVRTPRYVLECFTRSDKTFDEDKARYYTNVNPKDEVSREAVIITAAIRSVDGIIDFYKARVEEKLDQVNQAAKINTLKLDSFYVDGYYPATVMQVTTTNGGSATVRTTVEESSNKGTWYTRFPTRFHNCIGKDSKKVARPSWDRFIESVVEDIEAYREMRRISMHNFTIVSAIKREDDKIIKYESVVTLYTSKLDGSTEDRWVKRNISTEKRKIKKCIARKEELKKELK